jgi:hypothetical protein
MIHNYDESLLELILLKEPYNNGTDILINLN